MIVTITLSLVIIFAILLMLYSAVALIQNPKLFSSAPEDVQESILIHDERFPHAHLIGWILLIFSCLMITMSLIIAVWDGFNNNFDIWRFFIRFWVILWSYKIFDMIFIDWFLLTKSHFFQHYYPETKNCRGYNEYGFNLKSQLIKLAVFPFLALFVAFALTSIF